MSLGELIFAEDKQEFKEFYDLYSANKKLFYLKYKPYLQESTQDTQDLRPIDILQEFGTYKGKLGFTDWKGEENSNEIEEFIESQIPQKIVWTNTISLRDTIDEGKQREGEFIVKLFQTIDKDLQSKDHRLLFFDMGWDAYVFIPVTRLLFDQAMGSAPDIFESVDDL